MSNDYHLACHKCRKRILLGVMKVHGWYLSENGSDVLRFCMEHDHYYETGGEFGGPEVISEGRSEILDYEDAYQS